ncbi:sensor histidine kinase [Klebsiella variicola]|uniref:sensor histidine kinase n=1 Tax=Klebsiella variicola TaxID=244366 RepID=UPI000D748BF7|nr:ATP-binding protein [Klebsiella variicola]PXK73555.1 histidine kinase [Klebsiella variicola]
MIMLNKKFMVILLFILVIITISMQKSFASAIKFGSDIHMLWYADKGNVMTLHQFLMLDDKSLTTINKTPSFGFSSASYWLKINLPATYFSGKTQWLKVGPSFLDHLTVFYRFHNENGEWTKRSFGDLSGHNDSDIDYRESVIILNSPPEGGYDIVFNIKGTSALLLNATLYSPEEYADKATLDTAVWSFYFGIAIVIMLFSLTLAFLFQRLLLWSISLFSLVYILVASLHGYIEWIFGIKILVYENYMVSILSLFAYTIVLWLYNDVFNLKVNMPWLNKLLVVITTFNVFIQLSIPFGFYGYAVKFEMILYTILSPVIITTAGVLLKRKLIKIKTLIIGLIPTVYSLLLALTLLSLNGVVRFYSYLSVACQYMLLFHMMALLLMACLRLKKEINDVNIKKRMKQVIYLERKKGFAQRQFMGMIAHEFKTPLAVIMASIENIRIFYQEESTSKLLDRMQKATIRASQLTDNCLMDARLSSESVRLCVEETNLLSLIKISSTIIDVSDSHSLLIKLNGNILTANEIALLINVDADLIRIAISNIFDNAIKFSMSGIVTVSIVESDKWLVIEFYDEGPGVDFAIMDSIFKRYSSSYVARSSAKVGTGLGLYVARKIVENHGGQLDIKSCDNGRSVFVMSIPYH